MNVCVFKNHSDMFFLFKGGVGIPIPSGQTVLLPPFAERGTVAPF